MNWYHRAMGRTNRRFDAAAVVALVLLAAAVFGQTATFGFISLDDPVYVSKNQHVARGLTPGGGRLGADGRRTARCGSP